MVRNEVSEVTWAVRLHRGGQFEREVSVVFPGARLHIEDYQHQQSDVYEYTAVNIATKTLDARYSESRKWD